MKKLITFITVFAFLIGVFQVPSVTLAVGQTPITVKQAVEIAKSTLGLKTEDYTFSSRYVANYNDYNLWVLDWRNTKYPNESIHVIVDADSGNINEVNSSAPMEQPKSRMPKYSKAEALKAAQEIIAKLQGNKLKHTRLVEDTNNDYYNSFLPTHNFIFARVYDGIDLPGDTIQVTLDKNTLKLISFSIVWKKGSLPSKANAMSLEKATQAFKEKLGLELTYGIIHNYATNAPSAVLAYTLKNKNFPIDAFSGELLNSSIITPNQPINSQLTLGGIIVANSIEQTELVKKNKYITKEVAEQAIRQYVRIQDNLKLERADLHLIAIHQAGIIQNTFWNLDWRYLNPDDNTYRYINAQVDAVTNEVIGFIISDSSYNRIGEKTIIDKDQAKKLAEEFLKKVQPDKFKKTVAREYTDSYYGFIPYNNNYYRFSFIRIENGIPCPGNSLFVTINAITGEITSYSTEWMDLSFPALDKVITLDTAYEVLYDKVKFEMQYIQHYKNVGDSNSGEQRLAYVLENIPILIDASKGIMLYFDGTPITPPEQKLQYTDIKGNKSESAINVLTEMGIFKPNTTKFMPDSKILQKDFIKLLLDSMNPEYYYQPLGTFKYDNYYNLAIQRKIIIAAEKKPDAYVTRQDAAKMLVRAMGYGALAEKSDFFAANFKDASKLSKAYKGYAVIATALGIIPPIRAYFYPANNITKGDAAEFIVNFLKCDTLI